MGFGSDWGVACGEESAPSWDTGGAVAVAAAKPAEAAAGKEHGAGVAVEGGGVAACNAVKGWNTGSVGDAPGACAEPRGGVLVCGAADCASCSSAALAMGLIFDSKGTRAVIEGPALSCARGDRRTPGLRMGSPGLLRSRALPAEYQEHSTRLVEMSFSKELCF